MQIERFYGLSDPNLHPRVCQLMTAGYQHMHHRYTN